MGKKLTPAQAKSLAYSLYINEDLSYVEIADKVGYTPVSVGNWARGGSWKELKEALASTSDNQLKNFASQLNALNLNIGSRTEGNRFPNSKEADVQIKLTKAILMFRGEADLTEILTYNKLFLGFLRTNYPDKLKEYTLMFDEFVKERI
jgi:hypothetical protein